MSDEKKLYVLVDRQRNAYQEHLTNNGLFVTALEYNVDAIKRHLVLEAYPYVLLIIDTGTGKFNDIEKIEETLDLTIANHHAQVYMYYRCDSLKDIAVKLRKKMKDRLILTQYSEFSHVLVDLKSRGYVYPDVVSDVMYDSRNDYQLLEEYVGCKIQGVPDDSAVNCSSLNNPITSYFSCSDKESIEKYCVKSGL